ncbi:DeoR/GlpR family DNA-binding transcription regulator [Defluviitalea phaphyphila]|uniref:DeoR/GlpR family DNA-binding transcription regulator n=1 Tax=Defluviitalea phaphyphila TaxID=1473580 RepID=UPI000731DBC5|nr:DeoR/GlpR family DNA-binding transcription regulator [Defluviitalea phaphyphila]
MLPIERRKYIMDKLNLNGSVKVEELAKEMNVTPMTVRRDLDKLEAEDLLKRTHGGAVLSTSLYFEEEYDVKKEKNIEIKKKIAQSASELIKGPSTIFLDAGTTTYELANILKNRNDLVIITGDLKIASLLYRTENEVHFLGGKLEKKTGAVLSVEWNTFIERINIDYAFLGGSAITNQYYLTTPTFEKAKLKSKLIELADKSVLLVDESKFGVKSLVKIAHIKDFDVIITNKVFNNEFMKELKEKGVEVRLIGG